jgi:23S rRNA (uridine2552-2'-O)-methyltransferase
LKLSDARRDFYRKIAKQEGYRSRSAYKLIQLNNSYHFLKFNDIVIDIGCAPGGWLQVTRKEIGVGGKVIGIDLKEVSPIKDVITLRGDIEDQILVDQLCKILKSKADVLLSDLAPNVSGIWDIDQFRQISLTKSAFHVAKKVLRKGGKCVFKVFEGNCLKELKDELKLYFDKIYLSKPNASRHVSSELYIICFNFLY